MEKIGYTPHLINKNDVKLETLFDQIPQSIAVNVPCYNQKAKIILRRERLSILLGDELVMVGEKVC